MKYHERFEPIPTFIGICIGVATAVGIIGCKGPKTPDSTLESCIQKKGWVDEMESKAASLGGETCYAKNFTYDYDYSYRCAYGEPVKLGYLIKIKIFCK